MEATEVAQRGRERQAELYGAPLGELFSRVAGSLGLSDARLARTLGISAPMLSQLRSGARVKIGNPSAVDRLRALERIAAQVAEEGLDPAGVEDALARVAVQQVDFTRAPATSGVVGVPDARASVRVVQELLRAVASAQELLAAADAVEGGSPALAEVLRVYGAGRTESAVDHWQRLGG